MQRQSRRLPDRIVASDSKPRRQPGRKGITVIATGESGNEAAHFTHKLQKEGCWPIQGWWSYDYKNENIHHEG
jgi:hypothetical protein